MQSADELYQQARQRWLEVIDLSVYDDQNIIYDTISILEKALRQDPTHIKSLTLLT